MKVGTAYIIIFLNLLLSGLSSEKESPIPLIFAIAVIVATYLDCILDEIKEIRKTLNNVSIKKGI